MITAAQEIEIAKEVRAPRSLLKITHADGIIRLASGGNVTWDSQSWLKSGFKVTNVKTGKAGVQTARVTIINENNIYSELAILGKFNYKRVEYWEYYGANPATDDPVKRFAGEITKIPSMSNVIVFDCATTGALTKRIPFLTLGAPDVNHMPRSGQRIHIGNEIFTIEVN